jgi:hypothetical protein
VHRAGGGLRRFHGGVHDRGPPPGMPGGPPRYVCAAARWLLFVHFLHGSNRVQRRGRAC